VPRVPSRAKARVTLVLWVSQHYVLAVRALDADPSHRAGEVLVPNSDFDTALIPTASQLQVIFEQSAQMAALHAVGATDSDTPDLAAALANEAGTARQRIEGARSAQARRHDERRAAMALAEGVADGATCPLRQLKVSLAAWLRAVGSDGRRRASAGGVAALLRRRCWRRRW
jgi:hypothetical protein